MLNKISEYIRLNRLLRKDGRYIVGLSGGADSVALLRVLLELGYSVEAAHCNFHLRGSESFSDEEFAKALCGRLGVPFHVIHFDTRDYAELHHESIEMAARELRYAYFAQLKRDIEADGICVAHHRDDNVETVLINLLRGTGIRGLNGMRPRNGDILRPLLCVSRKDVLDYLRSRNQPYVVDSSNLKDDVIRNKIRLRILPMLAEINPAVYDNIQRTADNIADATAVYMEAIADARRRCMRDGSILISAIKSESVLFEILRDFGFSSQQVRQVWDIVTANRMSDEVVSGQIFMSADHELLVNRGELHIQPRDTPMKPVRIPELGTYLFNMGERAENIRRLRIVENEIQPGYIPSHERFHVSLDAAKVKFPVVLRPVVNGDRFIPFGMKGSRLVSDFLTDLKRSVFEKRRQMVLVDASGSIVWVVGERPANPYCITKTTKKTLEISLIDSM